MRVCASLRGSFVSEPGSAVPFARTTKQRPFSRAMRAFIRLPGGHLIAVCARVAGVIFVQANRGLV